MRTTVNIEDDVLIASKDIARREKKSLGDVLSELVRRALQSPAAASNKRSELDRRLIQLGLVPYYAPKGKAVTNEQINRLKEEHGL